MSNPALRTVSQRPVLSLLALCASILAIAPAPAAVLGAGSVHRVRGVVELAVRVEVIPTQELDALGGQLTIGDFSSVLPHAVGSVGPAAMGRLNTLAESSIVGRGTIMGDGSFDLIERIEVLRGPEGTLFGSHAVSGTVNILSRKPGATPGVEELTVEVGSRCPARTGDVTFEDARRATCTAELPLGGALVFTGFVDDATRAWTADMQGLAGSGPLGAFLAGNEFRSGASDLFLVLSNDTGVAGGALDARFCALSPVDLAGQGVGPATGVVAPGVVLGTGDLSTWFATRGTGSVLGAPTAMTADAVPTEVVLGAAQGVDLDVTPRVLADGRIALSFGTKATLPELVGGSVIDTVRFASGAAVLEPGQSLVLGGLVNDRTLEAGNVPSLSKLPILGGLFKASDVAAQDRRLVVFITPRVVREDEEGRPLSSSSSAPSNQLLGPAPGELYVEANVGAVRQGLPAFEWLRTEIGGVIAERPLARFDDEASGTELGILLAKGTDFSLFGGRSSQVLIEARYIDADTSSQEELISAGGLGLGVEDPNGSGFFITPGNGDVRDVRFDLDYSSLGLGLGVREGFNLRTGCRFDLTTRFRYVGAEYDASMSGVTNSGTLDIRREDEIDSWLLGPALEGTVSRDFGWLKGYCAADLTLGYGSADATTRVLVGAFPERARDLDESQLVWELGARVGVRRERGDLALGLEVGAYYGNRYPIVEYQEFDPAKLEYESEWRTQIGFHVGYRF